MLRQEPSIYFVVSDTTTRGRFKANEAAFLSFLIYGNSVVRLTLERRAALWKSIFLVDLIF